MTDRTMAAIAARYDAERDKLLGKIRDGTISASMSSIEYYPKPWAELDMNNEFHAATISGILTWNGQTHDYSGMNKYSDKELELWAQIMNTYREPIGKEREDKILELRRELAKFSPYADLLEKARDDALEEAAKKAEEWQTLYDAEIMNAGIMIYHTAPSAIRTMKGQQR